MRKGTLLTDSRRNLHDSGVSYSVNGCNEIELIGQQWGCNLKQEQGRNTRAQHKGTGTDSNNVCDVTIQ